VAIEVEGRFMGFGANAGDAMAMLLFEEGGGFLKAFNGFIGRAEGADTIEADGDDFMVMVFLNVFADDGINLNVEV
jgi:hypothetical protein